MKAYISSVGKYLPEKIITNKEFESFLDTSDEWIKSRTGIEQRRQLEFGKASSFMAIKAIEELIERRKIDIQEIDCIIVSTITPDMVFPSTACLIQDHFKIKKCWGFDLSAACSGFLFGIETANSFIKSKKYKKIIVVGVDTMSSILDYEDRNTCILFGDGAGAVLMEESDDYGIIDSKQGIDGSGAKFLNMPGGGSLNRTNDKTVKNRMHYVKQNGSAVFKNAVKGMYNVTNNIMIKNNIDSESLNLFIAHQANKRIIESTAKRLKLSKKQVFTNINKYANTTAASIPIAITDAYEKKLLNIGDNLILTAFGAGFTWGSCLLKWGIPHE